MNVDDNSIGLRANCRVHRGRVGPFQPEKRVIRQVDLFARLEGNHAIPRLILFLGCSASDRNATSHRLFVAALWIHVVDIVDNINEVVGNLAAAGNLACLVNTRKRHVLFETNAFSRKEYMFSVRAIILAIENAKHRLIHHCSIDFPLHKDTSPIEVLAL